MNLLGGMMFAFGRLQAAPQYLIRDSYCPLQKKQVKGE
jgi:hypothetical protein